MKASSTVSQLSVKRVSLAEKQGFTRGYSIRVVLSQTVLTPVIGRC